MKKKNNKKWTLVLVLLLVVSIGYAALASNLKINGTSGVKANTWSVYWNNVQITNGSVSADDNHKARITDAAKTQVEFSVTLNEPGDFYEFTVDAVNNGTIDAMIASQGIVNGVYSDSTYETPATLPEAVSYTVTYADGKPIQEKHLLAKKNGNTPTTETYKVRIEYRNDDEIDPDDLDNNNDQTYYFRFSVNYVQADGNATPSHPSAIIYERRQVEGQITPGDIIGIGETEDFYVLSSDNSANGKTVLLAKYNLMVGHKVVNSVDIGIMQPENTQGYGLQSIDAIGGYSSSNRAGGIEFSNSSYWMNGNSLISPYNENDTIYYDSNSYSFKYRNDDLGANPYVYDSNSNIYQYINGQGGYVDKLKEMGAPSSITGRLLTYEEAVATQTVKDNNVSIIFDGRQSYWLGSAIGKNDIYAVQYDCSEPYGYKISDYTTSFGVRPVIEIPTSEIR